MVVVVVVVSQVMMFLGSTWAAMGVVWFFLLAPDDYEGMDTYGHGSLHGMCIFMTWETKGRRAGLGLGMGYHRWQYIGFC